jgi:predicted DNA-binding transcriptional regulator YafY
MSRTSGEVTISLTSNELRALELAAELLRARAERFGDDGFAALAALTNGEAATLHHLRDRWHLATVIADTGGPHRSCLWCANGALP